MELERMETMTENKEILERVRDRVKNLTRPQTSRDAYWRLVRAFGEAAMWARDPKSIESEAIRVAAFAVLLASVAKKEQPSPEDRARSLHGKLDRILKRLDRILEHPEPVVRYYDDPPGAPDADNEGPCPSCGAELGRDHRPGCRLPGVWSDLTHCQRVVQERRERCIVLWNVVRFAVPFLNRLADDRDAANVITVAQAALEGGPLGHQGEITDADRLTLSDVYRASGAAGRDDAIESDAKLCPQCARSPDPVVVYDSNGRCDVTLGCCGIVGPTCDGSEQRTAERRAIAGWNAVVDAWDRGFGTARATDA